MMVRVPWASTTRTATSQARHCTVLDLLLVRIAHARVQRTSPVCIGQQEVGSPFA